MNYLFAFVMLIHGLIHMMGFAKAFEYAEIPQLTKAISKPMGILWLVAAALFTTTVVMLLSKIENWPVMALATVFLSQILIISTWHDAKFGTIANVIIIIVAILTLTK